MLTSDTLRKQPSLYPFPWTYVLAASTIISTLIDTGILAYFTYYLRMDDMAVPGSFIFLLTISILTLLSTTLTTCAHITLSPSPKHLSLVNLTLLTLWLAGLAWISVRLAPMVLSSTCSLTIWRTQMGIMVCRIYKALYSFIVLATVCVAASLVLDYKVLKETSSRGAYREMKDSSRGGGQSTAGAREKIGRVGRDVFVGGLRRGFYTEMRESPDLRGEEDDGQRLIRESPDMSDIGAQTPYATPKL